MVVDSPDWSNSVTASQAEIFCFKNSDTETLWQPGIAAELYFSLPSIKLKPPSYLDRSSDDTDRLVIWDPLSYWVRHNNIVCCIWVQHYYSCSDGFEPFVSSEIVRIRHETL